MREYPKLRVNINESPRPKGLGFLSENASFRRLHPWPESPWFSADRNNKSTKSRSQPCPKCGYQIGVVAGSKEAICRNCGYKDPCCE